MAALFPPEYMGGMMSGCGIAGIVAIALRIITKGSMSGSTSSGILLSYNHLKVKFNIYYYKRDRHIFIPQLYFFEN
jgi:hypothetical protein